MGAKRINAAMLVVAGCALLSPFSGCTGNSPPSESDCQKIVQDRIANEANNRIRLVSFKKTDGQATEVFGVHSYKLEYECEIEFLEDCAWGPFSIEFKNDPPYLSYLAWSGHFRTSPSLPEGPEKMWSQRDMKDVKRGHRKSCSGSLRFERSESGWRLVQ